MWLGLPQGSSRWGASGPAGTATAAAAGAAAAPAPAVTGEEQQEEEQQQLQGRSSRRSSNSMQPASGTFSSAHSKTATRLPADTPTSIKIPPTCRLSCALRLAEGASSLENVHVVLAQCDIGHHLLHVVLHSIVPLATGRVQAPAGGSRGGRAASQSSCDHVSRVGARFPGKSRRRARPRFNTAAPRGGVCRRRCFAQCTFTHHTATRCNNPCPVRIHFHQTAPNGSRVQRVNRAIQRDPGW